jgi:hypothetical protein
MRAVAFAELDELLACGGRGLNHAAWTATRSWCTVGMGRPSPKIELSGTQQTTFVLKSIKMIDKQGFIRAAVWPGWR